MKNNKAVLAFSGGLDTTYCAVYLAEELGLEVHGVLVDTGGFDQAELAAICKRAQALGLASFEILPREEEYYRQVIKYLIFGNVLKNNTYPLSVSAERTVQALAIAHYARQMEAGYVAHGSTGAGNDQVRFDLIFNTVIPDVTILTPIRDQQLSRQQEMDYLHKHGVDIDFKQARYSINRGLWGTSVGGVETLTSSSPLPEEAWPSSLQRQEPQSVTLTFEKGQPVALDGKEMMPVQLVKELNELGAAYAIGRDIHVGDTIIGIKGRVGFEAPAALLIIKAHHLLEKHVLGKWQLYWKAQLADWYGMLLHEAQYLDPVMRNIEHFLASTQQQVSGEVYLTLHPYRFTLDGISSPYDLHNASFGAYGEMNKAWRGEDVKGFTKILANGLQLYHQTQQQHDKS